MLLAFLDANDLIGQSTCMIGCFKLGSVFYLHPSAQAGSPCYLPFSMPLI